MDRRDFLKSAAGVAATAVSNAAELQSVQPSGAGKMIGIQTGAVSFVDEGTGKVLDILQEKAHVNTLFLAVFTYGRGIAGRQVPGQPLPDHGKQEYDTGQFHGGNYATVHPQYYKDTVLKDTRAPDHGNLDILAEVLPEAKKRGIKTICWLEDVIGRNVPNVQQVQEKDLNGRNRNDLCLNNPNYRNFLTGLVEDYTRSYDIDGIMWGSERDGALCQALESGRNFDPTRVGCFCQFCEQKAKQRGIDFERTKQGFRMLDQFVRDCRNKRPVDGYYVTFWRIIMRYPEIIGWEQFWHDSLRETYAAMYERVKSAKASVPVGWHLWHHNSFSAFYRAQQDLQVLSKYSDFLKVVMYHNCAGERLEGYLDRIGENMYADFPRQERLDFAYRVMNFQERGVDQIAFTGLSPDYVARETKRALDGAAGTKTLIWPGIDIDVPTAANHSKCTPQGTKDAVLAALRAGAHGVLLSRKYSEMKLTNLAGAGEAIKELRLA